MQPLSQGYLNLLVVGRPVAPLVDSLVGLNPVRRIRAQGILPCLLLSLQLENYPKYFVLVGAQSLSNEGMITAPIICSSALKSPEPTLRPTTGSPQKTATEGSRILRLEGMKETLGGKKT